MAHTCPVCGMTCMCNGDIDDCCFDFDDDVNSCTCCDANDDNPDETEDEYFDDGPDEWFLPNE